MSHHRISTLKVDEFIARMNIARLSLTLNLKSSRELIDVDTLSLNVKEKCLENAGLDDEIVVFFDNFKYFFELNKNRKKTILAYNKFAEKWNDYCSKYYLALNKQRLGKIKVPHFFQFF